MANRYSNQYRTGRYLWNGKLTFSADWYIKKSTGLLFPLFTSICWEGLTAPYINVGDLENKGIDLLLGSKEIFRKRLEI